MAPDENRYYGRSLTTNQPPPRRPLEPAPVTPYLQVERCSLPGNIAMRVPKRAAQQGSMSHSVAGCDLVANPASQRLTIIRDISVTRIFIQHSQAIDFLGVPKLLESAEFSATLLRLVTCAHSRRARVR